MRERIAKRVAKEFSNGDVVNLGIGLPTLVANYIPENISITLQSENGFLGIGPAPQAGEEIPNLVNAGGQPVSILPGGAFFDSAFSFALIRGGHVAATVLGALQVDEEGKTCLCKDVLHTNTWYELVIPASSSIAEIDNEVGSIILKEGRWYVSFKRLQTLSGKQFDAIHSGNTHAIELPVPLPGFTFLRIHVKDRK